MTASEIASSSESTLVSGTAVFNVNPDFLTALFRLPDGVRVIGAEWDFVNNSVRIFIRGPGVPASEIGSLVPLLRPEGLFVKSVDEQGQDMFTYTFDWPKAFAAPSVYNGLVIQQEAT